MIPPDAIRVATAVRRALELEFPRLKRMSNRCMLASYALSFLLRGIHIKSCIIEGVWALPRARRARLHTWVLLGEPEIYEERLGVIVDLTLTQFIPKASPVSILSWPAVCYEPVRHLPEDIAGIHVRMVYSPRTVERVIKRAVALL